jgi:hypothetical protein
VHVARTSGLTVYEHALSAAMHDVVAAFRDNDDAERAGRMAREVMFWLTTAYGRDAVQDLAELLARRIAEAQVTLLPADDPARPEGTPRG